ncbi:MAG TPA: retropepsin-like aspartic protease [Oculatellaceae cyanobacterium]
MKYTFKYLGITAATLLISLEAVSVDAHTQQSLKADSIPNVELLAQIGQFPRRTLGERRMFRVPIQGRSGGIPIVAVTLNGERTFPMLVDTGASITTITPAMARAVGVRPQGKVKVTLAGGQTMDMPRGRISSINVGDAQLNDFAVLIGEVPLLGQNFFSEYNVTVARDFIVFRQRLR